MTKNRSAGRPGLLILGVIVAILVVPGAIRGAISYVGTGGVGSCTGCTSFTLTVPAHSADDLLVIWMASDGGAQTLTVSGSAGDCGQTWSYQTAIDEGTTTGRLAYRIATSTAACTATVNIGSTEAGWATSAAFAGVDSTTPFGVSATSTGTSNQPTVTQTTGVAANSWAIAVMGMDRDSVLTDSGYPPNTTGIHSGRSGNGSGDAGGSMAYDVSATSSEVYTWGAQDRADGFTAGIYEIREPAAGADTLTVSQTAVASADVPQGTANKLLQVLDLSIDSAGDGTTSLQTLTIVRQGTAVDADTTASGVKLWHDVDNNNAYTPGTDTQIDGSQTFSGGTVTFTSIGFTVNNGTPEKLLVTVDIAAAGTSTEGNTIGASTTAMTLSDSDTISGLPQTGNNHTITDSGDQLTVAQSLTGGGTVNQGTSNLVVQVLDLTANTDSVTLTQLVASQLGTAVDADTTAARLWHDVNNNNAYDPGTDTQLGSTGDFTGNGTTVTFTGFSFLVASAAPEKLLITVDIASGATPDNTIASAVNTATGVTVSAPDTVADTGTLNGDLFTIQTAAANDTLTVSQTTVASADVPQGTANKLLQVLDLSIDNTGDGTTTLQTLTIVRQGTAVDADTTASGVKLWHDVNNNNAYDPGTDTQLDGSQTFSGGTVTFTAIGFTINNGTPEKLLVTVDIAAAGTSTEGDTIGASTTAMTVSDSDTISGLPQTGNNHTITDSGDQLTVAQTLTGGGTVNQGASNLVVQVLDLTANTDSVTLTQLVASQLGTAVDADTTAARLWHDVNNNNAYDNGTDTQLGSTGDFTGNGTTVTFTGFSFPVASAAPEKLLITVDIAGGATPANTIASAVNTATGVTVSAPDTVADTGTLNGDLFTIQAATGDSLSASANTPIRALDPSVGETGLVMQRFQVDSDTSGDGSVVLSSVTVGDQGTAQTADIATITIYIDVDTVFDGSVQIGSASFTTDPVTVNLTGGTTADRTVTNPSPKYLWVVYDLDAAATPGRTIQSRVSAVGVDAPDTGATGLALDSNLLTIISTAQNDTTVGTSSAYISSCSTSGGSTGQITVSSPFTGDANGDGSTEVRYDIDSNPADGTISCSAVSGLSPRQCIVAGLAAGTYWLQVDFSDPDGVSGTDPQTLDNGGGGYTISTCSGADSAAPTVLVLSPWRGAVIGGTERVRVQVWDAGGALATTDLLWAVDSGTLANTGVTDNTNYTCGDNCKIFEFDLDTTTVNGGLTDDDHTLFLQASDGATPPNVARIGQAFQVRNLGAQPGGSGQLLRRTPGSRLCLDCHDLPTHSSQTTSTDYGNWAMACNDCHTPHGTTNIFLLGEEIQTPNSGKIQVRFENELGAVANSNAAGSASFVNQDADTDPGTNPAHGPCQACHTRTQGGGQPRWRNTTAGGNSDTHYTSAAQQACTNCHSHDGGFSGGGGGCTGCHFGTGRTASARRDVEVDFGKRSHHVGAGVSPMGGTLTDFDCVVCHAEGTITAGETATTDYHNDVGTKAGCNTNDPPRPCIDLKDVDYWDNANPNSSPVFRYDKQKLIDTLSGGTEGSTPGNWSSASADWRTTTSTTLDPFCLTCHDFNGATTSRNADTTQDTCTTPDPLNPFCDAQITNTYDQYNRTRVTDIASRATNAWRTGPGSASYTAQERDGSTEPRYTESPNCGTNPTAPGCGIPDPPLGVYSRHAIRGTAVTGGFSGAASVYVGDANANCTGAGTPLACCTGTATGTCGIPANRWTSATWAANSLMGCADCHTVDAANYTNGNAHGSNSEYLLKDASGTATIGQAVVGNPNIVTANCYRCHNSNYYIFGGTVNHTDNSSDWADTAGTDGASRVASNGNIFGISCMNCHGGVEGGTQAAPGTIQFGTIHGTNQTYGIGNSGGSGTRLAYRFMNGNSLRYFDPNSWVNATITCYTIDSGEQDSFGGCSQHDRSGKTFTKPVQRDLKY